MPAMPLNTGGLPQGELLGRYRSYEDAQKVVDHLAKDPDFDIKTVTIVGNELRSVEKVRGRLTYPRAAGTGALQGALFGVFMGLLLMLFSPQDPLVSLGMAVLMGMGIWMIFGVISFAARRGTRGFISASQLVATTFDVVCDFQVAGRARQLVKNSGVTSLNAWNDPTGKSGALTGGAASHGGQPVSQAPSAQGTTPPQSPSAPQTQPRPEVTSAEVSSDGAGPSSPASSEPQGTPASGGAEAQSRESHDAAGAPQPESSFEVDGRPRYGVRLSDVQRAETEVPNPEDQRAETEDTGPKTPGPEAPGSEDGAEPEQDSTPDESPEPQKSSS